MNKILPVFIVSSLIWLWACNDHKKPSQAVDFSVYDQYCPGMTGEQEDLLFDLYNNSRDTVIRHHDTAWVINRKYDTTIVHTGIFYYLPSDYPCSVYRPSMCITKIALDFKEKGQSDSASVYFGKVVAYVDAINHYQCEGELCGDMNGNLEVGINNAILASFAYTQLGDTTNAIEVLKPWLANVEAHSGIYKWFGRLCKLKYGEAAWAHELDACFNTLHRLKDDHMGETSDWAVKIFGASIGIGNADEEDVTSRSHIDRSISWIFCPTLN